MKKYFENCTTEAQLKKAYHKFCKELHPDNGGDPEAFKRMSAEYTERIEPFKAARKAAAEKAAAERKAAEEAAKKHEEETRKRAAENAAKRAAKRAAKAEGDIPQRVADAIEALRNAGFEAGYHRRTYLWVNWPGAGKVRINVLKSGEFSFSYHGRVFAGVKSIDDLLATLRQ